MSKNAFFLISYRLDSQPCTVEVEVEGDAMTPDQARYYLGSIHTSASPDAFTDVQVTRIGRSQRDGPASAHDQQP